MMAIYKKVAEEKKNRSRSMSLSATHTTSADSEQATDPDSPVWCHMLLYRTIFSQSVEFRVAWKKCKVDELGVFLLKLIEMSKNW